MKIIFYQKPNERMPVVEFLDALSDKEAVKVTGCLASIKMMAFDSPRVLFRQIKGHLWEIKMAQAWQATVCFMCA